MVHAPGDDPLDGTDPGSGRHHNQATNAARPRPTANIAVVGPIHVALSSQLVAMPSVAMRLPRRDTCRPFAQRRSASPQRGWANKRSRHSGAPLPQAQAPMSRNTVVGNSGMKALTMPMATLAAPNTRQAVACHAADRWWWSMWGG